MRKAVRLIACVLCFILVFPSVSLPVFAYTSLGEVRAQEAVVQEIQDQVDSGSLGFFRANNGEESEAVQTILSRIETQGGDQWGTVNPGVEGDATNLENFRIAILMIIKGNELRAQEELFPGLEPLRVSDYLMALSEIQTSASKNLTQHSQMFNVGENLAWGYSWSNGVGPFEGWYFRERRVYVWYRDLLISEGTPDPDMDQVKARFNNATAEEKSRCISELGISSGQHQIGHYTNLVTATYTVSGAACCTDDDALYNSAYGQVFFYSDTSGQGSYTAEEYLNLFDAYCEDLYQRLEEETAELERLRANCIECNWGTPAWEWSADHTEATARFTNTLDPSLHRTVAATVTESHTDPDCLHDGGTVYTAEAFLDGERYTDTYTDTIPALGHDFGGNAAPDADGQFSAVCLRCGESVSFVVPSSLDLTYLYNTKAEPERFTNYFGLQDPVQDDRELFFFADGWDPDDYIVISSDGSVAEVEGIQPYLWDSWHVIMKDAGHACVTIRAKHLPLPEYDKVLEFDIEHAYGTAQYEWSADNSSVTGTIGCAAYSAHSITQTVATTVSTTATCTSDGVTTYTAPFEDPFTIQTKQVNTPALGHDWSEWTWDAENNELARVCSRDPSHWEAKDTVTEVSVLTETPRTGRTPNTALRVNAQGHDCTPSEMTWYECTGYAIRDGVLEMNDMTTEISQFRKAKTYVYHVRLCLDGWENGDGSAVFFNGTNVTYESSGVDEIHTVLVSREDPNWSDTIDVDIIFDALNGGYGKPEWTWAEDYLSAQAEFKNKQTGDARVVIAQVTGDYTDFTCEEGGNIIFTASAVLDGDTYTDVQHVTKGPGHQWIRVKNGERYSELYDRAWVVYRCDCDPEHTTEAEATRTYYTLTEPTCETDGLVHFGYTLEEENAPNGRMVQWAKRVTLPALGHDYQFSEWVWASDGSYAACRFVCSRDTSHVHDLEATIERETQADGSVRCTATVTLEDGTVYTDTKTVPAGHIHNFVLTGWNWAEDLSTAEAVFTCTGDASHTLTVHAQISVEQIAPTCTVPGRKIYTATAVFSGQTYTDVREQEGEPALGHDYQPTEWYWQEDYRHATLWFACAHDPSDIRRIRATVTPDYTDFSCETGGTIVYTAKAEFEGKEYTDIRTVETQPGHVWVFDDWRFAEEYDEAWACYHCDVDGTHRTEIPASNRRDYTKVLPNCVKDGRIYYYYELYSDDALDGVSRNVSDTVVFPALGHAYGDPQWHWEPDGSAASAVFSCTRCDEQQTVEASVTSRTAGKETVFTAEVLFGGQTYTDELRLAASQYLIVDPYSVKLRLGEIYPLTVESSGEVSWTSMNEKVATVDPDGVITAHYPGHAMIIASMGGLNAVCEVTVEFTDVTNTSDFFYAPVYWAVENGVTSGYTDKNGNLTGLFGPNDSCTRAQIVTFLYRAAGSPDVNTSGAAKFKDVKKSDYFYKPVLWAAQEGITTGYTDKNGKPTGYFGSNDECTRGQIVTFLYRWKGQPSINTSNLPSFKDVKKADYFYKAVVWAYQNNITTGLSKTKFAPNDVCTRGQVVTFLYRAR